MIEVHDPIRIMVIVEHFPGVLLDVIRRAPEVYEWYINEWMYIASVHPETREIQVFKEGRFVPYKPLLQKVDVVPDVTPAIEQHHDNLPVYALS